MNIPEKLSKAEYNDLLNSLKEYDLTKYTGLIRDNYKKHRIESEIEYILKSDIDLSLRKTLDYVFKRIMNKKPFNNLEEIAVYLRNLLDDKKYILIFAYNGTGKTRLSTEFKILGQTLNEETREKTADTLYYNAFTEDLFYWDNDLEHDSERCLRLNSNSKFFAGLKELEMESRIRLFLQRYADFDFIIDYNDYKISFYRDIIVDGTNQRVENIKVSRGEENIFIWCFFLAIVQLVVDKEESYSWVKYIYIDDPISSLDDNNAVAIACNLAILIKDTDVKAVVSTHHALFFNVICNEINKSERLFLKKMVNSNGYILKDTSKSPFFHHIALLNHLKIVADSGKLYTYHFNILRNILEKTAIFHGYNDFGSCLRKDDDNIFVYRRLINILSHGSYSIFEPKEMVEENKEYFRIILNNFIEDYKFNHNIFDEE